MDKSFIKQALHFANTIWSFAIVNIMLTPSHHHHGVGAGMAIMLFGLLGYIGALILVLCPNKRISLGIIALGFVLCCCVFTPPIKYMGHILLSVGALVFWACFIAWHGICLGYIATWVSCLILLHEMRF
ncbi:hypothetical protein [Helicobacter felis]|uniref:hypothetical protein n=1 Tax=Helicobacter felis TaxID=214 RepID=UPI000CED8439|nr:hypothetical protein [Helicobacter felis]